MLKIWGRKSSSNVMKVLWASAELGLPFDRVDWAGEFGGNDDPAYRALNPNGVVPTIEDDGFALWESNAIVRYLARKHDHGGLCPSDSRDYADADRWMDWQQTTAGPAFGPIFQGLVRTPADKRDMNAIGAAVKRTGEVLGRLDGHLKGRDFLLGPRLTMADIPLGPLAHRWFTLPIDRAPLPNVEAWYKRLCKRDGFHAHIASHPVV